MRGLALRDRTTAPIQNLANALGDPLGIDGFLRQYWRVTPDPDEIELISSPFRQLALFDETGYLAGDCDEAATLSACLLAALVWPCSLVAIRLNGYTEFTHVFTRAWDGGRGSFDIDPIVPPDALPIGNIAETLEVTIV